MKFFHTWSFYYLYSADYKFFQKLLKKKFTFAEGLFGDFIKHMKNVYLDWINSVFSNNNLNTNPYWTSKHLVEVVTYVVPLVKTTNG